MKRFVDTFSRAEQVADEARAVQRRLDTCPCCNRPELVWRKCKQVCGACRAIIRTCGDL